VSKRRTTDAAPPDKSDKPKRKQQGGRKPLLTKEREETLVDLLQRGGFIEASCRAVGITRETFYAWKAQGRADPESIYGKFLEKVEDAVAFHEARAVTVISNEADTNAEVMLKFMRIRHRKRWSETNRTELTGKGGGPVQVENKTPERLLKMSTKELAEYLSTLADDLRPKDPS